MQMEAFAWIFYRISGVLYMMLLQYSLLYRQVFYSLHLFRKSGIFELDPPPFPSIFTIFSCSHCSVIRIQTRLQTLRQLGCSAKTSVNTTGEFVRSWNRAGQLT
ncbi:hypothetical protein BHE74_00031750, partial [Ensete ventricosum]